MELIRQATPEDAAALAALDELSDAWPWPKSSIVAACAGTANQSVLVLVVGVKGEAKGEAKGDPNIVAYVAFARTLDEGSIYRIAVHSGHRQKGLGGRLLDSALLHLRELGACRTVLELRRSNTAAQALYSSRGFSLDGERKGYYPGAPNREDALLMSLSWLGS